MSEHLNNQIYLQIIEAIGRNEPDELDQYMSANVVDHTPIPGPSGFTQWMNMARSAFPDLHATIEDVMTDDDKVVGRVTWYGTQQGSFAGIEPTGKKIAFTAIHIVRFENGKAVEWWGIADLPGAI